MCSCGLSDGGREGPILDFPSGIDRGSTSVGYCILYKRTSLAGSVYLFPLAVKMGWGHFVLICETDPTSLFSLFFFSCPPVCRRKFGSLRK